MKLNEVIKLATSGYSVAEIRELGELSRENPELLSLADGRKMDELKELMKLADEKDGEGEQKKAAEGNPGENQGQDGGESDRNADLKRLREENEKLKESLKNAQKANAAAPTEKKDEKTVEDALVDFYLKL